MLWQVLASSCSPTNRVKGMEERTKPANACALMSKHVLQLMQLCKQVISMMLKGTVGVRVEVAPARHRSSATSRADNFLVTSWRLPLASPLNFDAVEHVLCKRPKWACCCYLLPNNLMLKLGRCPSVVIALGCIAWKVCHAAFMQIGLLLGLKCTTFITHTQPAFRQVCAICYRLPRELGGVRVAQ